MVGDCPPVDFDILNGVEPILTDFEYTIGWRTSEITGSPVTRDFSNTWIATEGALGLNVAFVFYT